VENSFATPQGELHIYDVINNQVAHLDALLVLYTELFPQYVSALSQVRERALLPADVDPRFIRHQWLVTFNRVPVALASFGLGLQRGIGFCLSIAIRPMYRRLAWGVYPRLSAFMVRQMVRQLEADAARSKCPPRGMVVEIDMADPAKEKSRPHLIDRYREYGFVSLPVAYYEPAFVRNASVGTAQLMELYMLPIHADCEQQMPCPKLLNDVVDTMLLDHYGLAENDWIVQQARKSIENAGENIQ
jgi:hypothetical protein